MPDKKILQLDSTSSINTGAMFPLSQTEGGSLKTVKGTVDQIGDYIAKVQDHSTLNTVSKKIIGAINEILASGIGDIEETASGSIASFDNGGDNIPVKTLVANITAVQAGEGTPAPDNIRAISGWSGANVCSTGKNLFDNSDVVQGSISSATGKVTSSTTRLTTTNIKKVKSGTSYTISCNSEVNVYEVFAFDTNRNLTQKLGTGTGSSLTITTGANDCFIRVSFRYSDNSTILPSALTSPQIEEGSSVTTYEPFGTTHNIPFGQTVYGGILDVLSGVLTVTHLKVSGKVTEVVSSSYSNITYGRFAKPNDAKDMGKASINLISSEYEVNTRTRDWDDIANIGKIFGGASTAWYWIGFTKNTSLADMQTESNDNEIVYELATPITIQLTPTEVRTLLGENNIYANSGDVEVEYFNEDASQFNDLIETIITSSSSDYHVYSTNEKVVGRWIDGKPIYEKTFTNIAVQSSLSQLVDDSVSYGTLIDGSINIANGVGFAYVQDNDIFLRAYVSSNKLYVAKKQATDWAGSSYAFIYVRYTKSTD